MQGNSILYGAIIVVEIILVGLTLVTKGELRIATLIFLFSTMSCAEIYWYSKYQGTAEQLKMYKYNYEQAMIEAREKRELGLKLLCSIGDMIESDANKKPEDFIKEPKDPMCLCGHPQSEHGSMGVCLNASKCRCTNFTSFRTVKS